MLNGIKSYRCLNKSLNPDFCQCANCVMRRADQSREREEARNIASTGSVMPVIQVVKEDEVRKETPKEKIERQRRERFQERANDWEHVQANQSRYVEQRAETLAKRQKKVMFELGWMQSPTTQSQDELWGSLFTSETKEVQKQYIQRCNLHLNDPVREGEIVLLPTTEPDTQEDRDLLNSWIEQARIASAELGKLLDEEVVTLNRHFDLFSHQIEERVKSDGLPSDYYAQVATGVGATSALVEQNLKNIQNVLLEINDLYASQVAMASRTGGMSYGTFVADRAELFKKLDGSFAMLSKRSVQLPIYTQVKRNLKLKLSTKSVIHNADEILKTGYVKELGKRIGNIAIGISAARGLGYIGLGIGIASGVDSIYEACKVDGSGECGKTTSREVGGFIGGFYGGGVGGSAMSSGVLLVLGVVGITSAPVLAIAAIGSFVVGGAIGGIAGSATGKWGAESVLR